MSEERGRDQLHGAWWPRSRDLAVELADLVDHFPPRFGRIVRAVFSPPDWEPVQRRIPVAGGYVKAGSFPGDDTHVVILKTSDRTELKVLVAAASLSQEQGERVLRAAIDERADTAVAVLTAATAEPTTDDSASDSGDHWNDDGGAQERAGTLAQLN